MQISAPVIPEVRPDPMTEKFGFYASAVMSPVKIGNGSIES